MRLKIKIVGAGGIGGRLLPALCLYLNDKHSGSEVTIIDGKSFDVHNRSRQQFGHFGNKAEVLAQEYALRHLALVFKPEPCFLNDGNKIRLLRERDQVFACVDNHPTRKLISDRCAALKDVIVFSGGNNYTDGSIQVFWRSGGHDRRLPLASEYHPEIQNPRDKHPEELGCDEEVSKPQLVIVNNFIAALMLNAFYAYLHGKLEYDEAYADCISNKVRSVDRSTQ